MKKLFSILVFGMIFMNFAPVFAGQSDYVPVRTGITQTSHPYGLWSSVEFNRFTDDTYLAALRGYGSVVGNYSDERDFVSAKKGTDYADFTDGNYVHTLSGLNVGDRISIFAYLHNNATQYDPNRSPADLAEYERNIARNTQVIFDWTNPQEVTATITANNAIPTAVTDTVSLRFNGNYTIRPINNPTAATTRTVILGDLPACYSYVQRIYFSFEVISNGPTCGNSIIEPPETCDDGNLIDGDGCSSVCQLETPDPNFQIVKTSNKEGLTLTSDDQITYTLTVTNTGPVNLENIVLTDILEDNLTFVSGDPNVTAVGQTVTVDFGTTVLSTGQSISRSFIAQVITNPQGSQLCNVTTGTATRNGTPIQNTSQTICNPLDIYDPNFRIIKSATPVAGSEVTSGTQVTYSILITNTGPEVLNNVIITDTLASNITFVSGDPSVSAAGQVVTITVGDIPISGSVTYDFIVQVNSQVAFCNTAQGTGERNGSTVLGISNEVCHGVPGGGPPGPPGGPPTTPTIGTCTAKQGSAGWQCTPRYPNWDLDDPLYVAYDNCVRIQHNPQSTCLTNWAASKNFVTCGLSIPYTGSYNADTPEVQSQCNVIIPPNPPGCKYCASCFGGMQTIKKEVYDPLSNTWIDDQISVSSHSKIKYKTTLTLGIFDTVNAVITDGKIKFYDFVIPSESGNIWNRMGIITPGWNWISGGSYYEKNLSGAEINSLNSGGLITSIEYEMDSEVAIDKNESNYLKNVTFAVIEYDYYDNTTLTSGHNIVGLAKPNSCNASALSLSEIYQGSTLGDTAEVRVIRPRLETLGGNIGVEVGTQINERLFGIDAKTGGQIITNKTELFDSGNPTREVTDFDTQKTFLENARNDFFNNLKQNAVNDAPFFGKTFKTTPANSGIYFINGDVTISGNFTPTQSSTFILESGNLTISSNFKVQGNNFVAFIVRTGDLIINSAVSELDGIFIVESGEIKSNAISQLPLTISGSLMGNGENLLDNRRFIGTNPEVTVEPAIRVNFDLRLLEQTPPAIEMFLGENWREDVE